MRSNEMNDAPVWERISTAPYDRDLELSVVEEGRVHPLVFACRRTPSGWVRATTLERVIISPTHWRLWLEGILLQHALHQHGEAVDALPHIDEAQGQMHLYVRREQGRHHAVSASVAAVIIASSCFHRRRTRPSMP
jgi:hypothetical protein